MESISIPSTIVQIGISSTNPSNLPFYNCTTLKNVKFEDGAQSLFLSASYRDSRAPSSKAKGLFEDCPLEEVYIGRNISYIDSYVTFEESPDLCDYSAFYKQTKLTKALISSSVTAIPKYLFYRCSALSDVDIQGQLVEIPMYSFEGCNISALTLPNSVKNISKFAFSDCSNLTNFDLGNSLVTIGDFAFYSSSVSSITIPNSVTKIGKYCFANSI